jgi:hypothetical protein
MNARGRSNGSRLIDVRAQQRGRLLNRAPGGRRDIDVGVA